ncbi:MAG: hypothetical protein ACK5GJ_14835, partial [Planctomycetota bacterium]
VPFSIACDGKCYPLEFIGYWGLSPSELQCVYYLSSVTGTIPKRGQTLSFGHFKLGTDPKLGVF